MGFDDDRGSTTGLPATAIAPPIPPIDAARVRLAQQDDTALAALAVELLGTWPFDAQRIEQSAVVPGLVREILPESFGQATVVGATLRIAGEFAARIIGRYRPGRGAFAGWLRLTVEDLTIQEAIHRYHAAKLQHEELRNAPRHAPRAAGLLRDARAAVMELVWLRFFFAAPDAHGQGTLALCPAERWVLHRARKSGDGAAVEFARDTAELFFAERIGSGDILTQFDATLGASFNQWLRIALERYTLDQLDRRAGPETVSLTDEIALGYEAGGHRVHRLEGTPRDLVDDPAMLVAGIVDDADLSDRPAIPHHIGFRPRSEGERLAVYPPPYAELTQVLDGLVHDPVQVTLLKLCYGLTPTMADCARIAHERLAIWGARHATITLGVSPAGELPGLDTTLPLADEVVPIETAFFTFATNHSLPAELPASVEEAILDAPWTDPAVSAIERYFHTRIAPGLHARGSKRSARTPAPPDALTDVLRKPKRDLPILTAAIEDLVTRTTRVVAAFARMPRGMQDTSERRPRPTNLEALAEALGAALGEAERERGVEETDFRARALRTILQRQTHIRRLEARRRYLDATGVDDAVLADIDDKLGELTRLRRQKADELRRKRFEWSDADLGRMLGIRPGAVASLKCRLQKDVADLLDADTYDTRRRRVASVVRKALGRRGASLLDTYDVRLDALGAWTAAPRDTDVRDRLLAVTAATDPAALERYRDALHHVAHAGDLVPTASATLADIRGAILDRPPLLAAGVATVDLVRYEEQALAIATSVAHLHRAQGLGRIA